MIDIPGHFLGTDGGRKRCVLRIYEGGVAVWFGKKLGADYPWGDVRRVSFDDPGRTKASGAAIALFGVWGLAARRAFTFITVTVGNGDIWIENELPVGAWRAAARRIVEDMPSVSGRIYVDGELVNLSATTGHQPGWYPDPHGQPLLRWYDGSTWTDHTAPQST